MNFAMNQIGWEERRSNQNGTMCILRNCNQGNPVNFVVRASTECKISILGDKDLISCSYVETLNGAFLSYWSNAEYIH